MLMDLKEQMNKGKNKKWFIEYYANVSKQS